MTLLAVEVRYKDGKVELSEAPAGAPAEARVIVTFLAEPKAAKATEAAPEPGDEARREAGERLLALFDEGISLGGPPYPTREEIYAERMEEPDHRREGLGAL